MTSGFLEVSIYSNNSCIFDSDWLLMFKHIIFISRAQQVQLLTHIFLKKLGWFNWKTMDSYAI